MLRKILMRTFVGLVSLFSICCLIYVYTIPIKSMKVTRDGVPYFTPPVIHPENGNPITVGDLVQHFKGEN